MQLLKYLAAGFSNPYKINYQNLNSFYMAETNYPSATGSTPVQPAKNNNSKNIVIGALAAVVLGSWGYFLWDKNKSSEKLSNQQTQITSLDSAKTEIQMEFDNALARLDSVTGANNNLQGQLADRQKEIDAKKAEIRKILNDKNATQSQLAKAKSMITELNDKISTLEAEVARLTGENEQLTADNTTLKQEKSDLEQNLTVTKTEKENLEKTVDVGSTFSASNIHQFLDSRGFGREAAEKFGVGYAPQSGRALGTHLKSKGFSEEELIGAGLMRQGGWDFFQGRALWPIRDAGAAVLGFGARRLRDDDRMPAKYLNTPETAVYKKSQVLYGLDLARQSIGKKAQAVVVEGYTDVMAAHLSGVDTAVASCGTAFGDDHARLIQRLLGGDAFHGEVIFTFDGDSAGQKAALKVFGGDQHFAAQTYVAVERSGLDPCDLRLERGEAAVRELVATRQPLYRFVMTNVISQFDLDRVDGRLGALRAAAPLIGSIRDTSLVAGYVRELAQLVGMDLDEVRQVVSRVANRRIPGGPKGRPAPTVDPGRPYDDEPPPDPQDDGYEETLVAFQLPSPDDRSLVVERDTLKLMLQRPTVFDKAPEPWFGVTAADFTHPAYAAVFTALNGVDRAGAEERRFAQAVVGALTDESLRHLAMQLSVEPLPVRIDVGYARTYCAKLSLLSLLRTIADLKSRLQRTNPVENEQAYNQMFGRMVALEVQRKELLRLSSGD